MKENKVARKRRELDELIRKSAETTTKEIKKELRRK
jgi:hypothetical protein